MIKEYSWNCGGFFNNMDASKVGAEIESLGDNITPENIVQLAKRKKSEMHSFFEWDNEIAGDKYRKYQASMLLTSLKVTYIHEEDNTETTPVRAFVTLKRNSKYEKIETVVQDIDRYAILKERAYKELMGIRSKYESISEIQEHLAFLDDIEM